MSEPLADAALLVDVVYRGPFQGRRIAFLLDTLDQVGARQRLFWLHPSPDWRDEAAFLADFAAKRPGLDHAVVLDGRPQAMPTALRALAGRRPRAALALAIGFTSLPFARAARAEHLVWCVNGIPEERLLYHGSAKHRAAVTATWRTVKVGRRPDATVTVSQPMATLVQDRLGQMPTFVAPTVVDRSTFQLRPPGPGTLTYIGSGAPWQDLPLLAEVWSAVHRLDGDVRFRVVSRDDRADVLRQAVPSGVVESVSAGDPAAVAEQLRTTQVGFIVRRPHLVNTVSFPTKFGEYVASGVGVVTTDIGWDLAALVRSTGCGLVLDVAEPPERMAEQIVGFLSSPEAASEALTAACDEAATALDRATYVKDLGTFLADLVS